MDTLRRSPTIRIIAAVVAVTVTTTLFSAVVSLGEPQRSELWARLKSGTQPTVTAEAPNVAAPAR